ncbi:MAG: hypothetical protein M0R80_01185 [Proteobacteria bacterium]|jgi:hypothetical protein|nr:hypothetical protein [Pseudomonadota bacterium]
MEEKLANALNDLIETVEAYYEVEEDAEVVSSISKAKSLLLEWERAKPK